MLLQRTGLCHLLATLAQPGHVAPWRIQSLKRHILNGQGVNTKGPVHLLKKFKIIQPGLVPENLSHYPGWPSGAPKNRIDLEKKFADVWQDQNPFSQDLDDLMPDCPLSWEDVIHQFRPDQPTEMAAPEPKRCRLSLPGPEIIGPEDQSQSTSGRGSSRQSIALANCTTVQDIFTHLGRVSLPAQSLALLRQKALFMLLVINKNPEKVQAKFSLALYHTLHNEFFGGLSGSLPRQQYILQRMAVLQSFFQQGIPVVSRFLVEFLPTWNGEQLLLEILSLITHIQITDFEECILSPLMNHFSKTFSVQYQIVTLVSLRRLIFHWITLEYERCKNHLKRFFGTANPNCINPLGAIGSLIDIFVQYCESGLAQALAESNPLAQMYFHEVLTQILMVSRCLVSYNLPLCLEMPPTFIYYALFQVTPTCLSRVLEHISMIKFEAIPICERAIKNVQMIIDEDEMATTLEAEAEMEVLVDQLKSKDALNVVTKDAIAVLSNETLYLDRGKSIFRLHWDIEEQAIRKHLTITNHIAFQPFIWSFVSKMAQEHSLSKQDVIDDLQDANSAMMESYLNDLAEHLPMVTDFLSAFQKPKSKKYARSMASLKSNDQVSQKSLGTSTTATSGISSMVPTWTSGIETMGLHPILRDLQSDLSTLKSFLTKRRTSPDDLLGKVTDSNPHLEVVCKGLEAVFAHGTLSGEDFFVLFEVISLEPKREAGMNALVKHIVSEIKKITAIKSNLGRGRHFLRCCLNNGWLTSLVISLRNWKSIDQWYQPDALLLRNPNESFMVILPDLDLLHFDLHLANRSFLDDAWQLPIYRRFELVPCGDLGLMVCSVQGRIVVTKVKANSCAGEDGKIQMGDLIDDIDATPTYGMDPDAIGRIVKKCTKRPLAIGVVKAEKNGRVFPPLKPLLERTSIDVKALEVRWEQKLKWRPNSLLLDDDDHNAKGDGEDEFDPLLDDEEDFTTIVQSGTELLYIGSLRISACGCCSTDNHYLAFIAGNDLCTVATDFLCHVFYCANQGKARDVISTIAEGFERTQNAV
eukprot:maker-scaffold11_size778918-snap-gene-0.13 protein:Tk03653 transcript:maker-scaffold11_size778918-snap-gene-0.13-mRNA-1 annotation:"hypothetical protein BRAFLDRAFT_120280"